MFRSEFGQVSCLGATDNELPSGTRACAQVSEADAEVFVVSDQADIEQRSAPADELFEEWVIELR